MTNLQNTGITASLNHDKFRSSYTKMESGCRIWNKSLGPRGHPRFSINGKWFNSSRIMLALANKEIPINNFVLGTKCNNKLCIFEDHLIIGTPTQIPNKTPKEKKKVNSIFDLSSEKFEVMKQKLVQGRSLQEDSNCWIYTEALIKGGYARFDLLGAHRCTFELKTNIRLHSNQHLEKTCKGPNNCINPFHWRLLEKAKTVKLLNSKAPIRELTPLDWEKFGNSYTINGTTGCWLRKGAKLDEYASSPSIAGYKGLFHRVSYQIHKGAIPEGLQLRHICNVKACGCPLHLIPGTAKEQGIDKKRNPKNRGVLAGSNNPSATIVEEQALNIWNKLKQGRTVEEISNDTRIKKSIISEIKKGNSWNFITGLPKKTSAPKNNTHKELSEMTTEDIERFWNYTRLESNKEDPCLIWEGTTFEIKHPNKTSIYSQHYWGRKNWNAYHIAYFLANGFLPDFGNNLVMRHLCGNGLCVKAGIDSDMPSSDISRYKTYNTPIVLETHLKLGTRKENAEDNKTLGVHTGNDGTFKYNAKLDSLEIRDQIRYLGLDFNLPATEIIDRLGLDVDPGTINRLLKGITWKDESERKTIDRTYRPFGERAPTAKLSEKQVYEIRIFKLNKKTNKEIAEIFGISSRHVDGICYGKSWSHLDPSREGYVPPLEKLNRIKIPNTTELITSVKTLYLEGDTFEEISVKLEHKSSKIRHIIEDLQKKGEVELKQKRTKVTEEIKKLLKQCYTENKNTEESKLITGLAPSTVEKHFMSFRKESKNN